MHELVRGSYRMARLGMVAFELRDGDMSEGRRFGVVVWLGAGDEVLLWMILEDAFMHERIRGRVWGGGFGAPGRGV